MINFSFHLDVIQNVCQIAGFRPALVDVIPVVDASSIGINDVRNFFVVEDIRPGAPVIDGIEEHQKWRHVFRIDAIHANCNNFEPVEKF